MDWVRGVFGRTPVVEAKQDAMSAPTAAQVRRTGFEYGIPLNTVSKSSQVAATSERQQVLNQLHQLYMTCDWVSSPIDVIARTITAGGLQIVSDSDLPEGEIPHDPPEVVRLRRLLKFTNPREDMIQLLRCVATDLLLFGDAYIEIVELLGEPVALYTLDATTMTVVADQHGEVTGYVQDVDGVRSAEFDPDQVIHISLDAPRGGLYGVSPAQKVLLPATAWLFTMATLKECFRRGDPPRFHVDLGHYGDTDVQRWREQYRVNNLGPKAVGEPLITTGGAGAVMVLDNRKVTDYLDTARQLRDEIISAFGVPPAKLGIIETGNLGGGTGEAQNKTFQVNTIIPFANLILEKLNYHLLQEGFGITDWHLEFAEIDFRDSKVVEEIRDMRIKNGLYTLNRGRDEIGEPPVDGGDDPILALSREVITWRDMDANNKANIASKLKGTALEPGDPGDEDTPLSLEKPEPKPVPPALAPFAGQPGIPAMRDPEDAPGLSKDATQGEPPVESWRRMDETYQRRRAAVLRELREKVPA